MHNTSKDDYFKFYVEAYERSAGVLWLDFISIIDLIRFESLFNLKGIIRDYSGPEYLPPTFLMLDDFYLTGIHEGGMLYINRKLLGHLHAEGQFIIESARDYKDPAGVLYKAHLSAMSLPRSIGDDQSSFLSFKYPHSEYINRASDLKFSLSDLDFLHSALPTKVVVWDVGQGNTNVIEFDDKEHHLLFDCGCDRYYSLAKINRILDRHGISVNDSGQDFILILSHFDLDHFNLLYTNPRILFDRIKLVMIPSFYTSLTAENICRMLKSRNIPTLTLPHTTEKNSGTRITRINQHLVGPSLDLFVGHQSRSTNNSGLLLTVRRADQAVLLTADHDNAQVWTDQYGAVPDYVRKLSLVVPHHGGRGRRNNQLVIDNHKRLKLETAVFSYGENNNYGHPEPSVLDKYQQSFDHIYDTKHYGDVTIML